MSERREVALVVPLRTVLLVGAAVAVGAALASIGEILLLIFASVFLAVVLSPAVDALERGTRWSRGRSAAVLVLGGAGLVVVLVLVIAAALVQAVEDLGAALPGLTQRAAESDLGRAVLGAAGEPSTLRDHAAEVVRGVAAALGGVLGVGASAFGAVTLAVSVTFMTLFLVSDLPRLRGSMAALLEPTDRARVDDVLDRIIRSTSRSMLGNLAISAICGTVLGLAAWAFGLPFPVALGVVVGVLDLVPNVGATVGGAVLGIAALTVGVGALVGVIAVVLVYQQVENYVLQPAIVGRAANVSGFTVIASVLVFGALFGLLGAIVAVPLAAAIEIVLDELTRRRRERIADLGPA